MSTEKNIRIKQKVDTSANWEANNPILLPNEIGFVQNKRNFKIGIKKSELAPESVVHYNSLDWGSIGIAGSGYSSEIFNDTVGNTATGVHSHTEGYQNTNTGDLAHVEGSSNFNSGKATHTSGYHNSNTHNYSVVAGEGNQSNGDCSVTIGKYAETKTTDIPFRIGNGTSSTECSNLLEINNDGEITIDTSNLKFLTKNNGGKILVNTEAKGVSIGTAVSSSYASIAMGHSANAASNSIAIGSNPKAVADNCCQLGAGINRNAGSLQFREYQLVDTDGHIPEDRIPSLSNKVNNVAPNGGFVAGDGASDSLGTQGIAIGTNAQGWSGIGIGANSLASAYSVALGNNTSARTGSIAIGDNSQAESSGIAIGGKVEAGNGTIQLGYGINSTEGSLQFKNYQLLDADGKIPNERLTNQQYVIDISSDFYSNMFPEDEKILIYFDNEIAYRNYLLIETEQSQELLALGETKSIATHDGSTSNAKSIQLYYSGSALKLQYKVSYQGYGIIKVTPISSLLEVTSYNKMTSLYSYLINSLNISPASSIGLYSPLLETCTAENCIYFGYNQNGWGCSNNVVLTIKHEETELDKDVMKCYIVLADANRNVIDFFSQTLTTLGDQITISITEEDGTTVEKKKNELIFSSKNGSYLYIFTEFRTNDLSVMKPNVITDPSLSHFFKDSDSTDTSWGTICGNKNEIKNYKHFVLPTTTT